MKSVVVAVVGVVAAAAIILTGLHAGWLVGASRSPVAVGPPPSGPANVPTRAANATGAIPAASGLASAVAPASSLPVEESTTNIVASDVGGHVDQVSGAYGPGFFGRWLIDGVREPVWKAVAPVTFPYEMVFSFYGYQPALISALSIVLPGDAASAPRDIEVWASTDSPPDSFVKVAARTLAPPSAAEQKIAFAPVEARQVKLRILSGTSPDRLAIAEVRIEEARGPGYTSLFTRNPDITSWKRSPRDAAQLGLDWLQQAAVDWQKSHQCFGCHVQAQVVMGQLVAKQHEYRVSMEALSVLERGIRQYQEADGSWFSGFVSPTQFGAMSLAYANEATGKASDPAFLKAVDWLLAHQSKDGGMPADREAAPIVQGTFMTSTNSIIALMRAHDATKDAKYQVAADRALAWIVKNQPETTQDKVFKVMALSRFGAAEQKRLVHPILDQLIAEQQSDGGWKERATMKGSNALATGQVLYALKDAGASIYSRVFRRGVDYLLESQVHDTHTDKDGTWPAVNTQTDRPSEFAPTMWAVIGLVGSYGTRTTGGLQVVTNLRHDKPPSRNLEIVLDASGSMKLALERSTRWQTALRVLEQLLAKLPADFNVGLRIYGHRYSSRSAQTCSDTELVVPLTKLDPPRILAAARRVQPRGETPLVRSVLVAADDLKASGNGSVIVITDGEESCHGDPKAAGQQLKSSGVDVTVNIVGFTLEGKTVEEELGGMAAATGGRYYSARNGDELARALTIAAAPNFPYEVFDDGGRLVATGETSALGEELAPGTYRVVVHALGQELTASVNVAARKDTVLTVALNADRFVFER